MLNNMDLTMELIIEEAKRRGLTYNATCNFCGDAFMKQELSYLLAHVKVCAGRDDNGVE